MEIEVGRATGTESGSFCRGAGVAESGSFWRGLGTPLGAVLDEGDGAIAVIVDCLGGAGDGEARCSKLCFAGD